MSLCFNPACPKPQNPKDARFCQTCGQRLLLGDRYRLYRPLGGGHTSRTFLGLDTQTIINPRCLVKEFKAPADPEIFRQELARLAAMCQHPQLPQLLAYFEREQRFYLVQEFIDGPNLLQLLATAGAWDEPQIRQLLLDLLPLLQVLHSQQIMHRDIKPQNLIRRSADDALMLVDFGAAKHATQSALARTGTVIGSAEYAAPEQLMGKATFASDLYSVGVTCIHLLTGLPPFELFNSSSGTWMWHSVAGPVSPQLVQVLDTLLQGSASQRYGSASEVMVALGMAPLSARPGTAAPAPQTTAHQTTAHQTTANWACSLTLTALSAVGAIAIAPDGQTLISGGQSPDLQRWDLGQSSLEQVWRAHRGAIASLAISPDSTMLASGSWDHTICLWDLHTGTLLHTLTGHRNVVTALAISPDGQTLISGSRDHTIRLWDLSSGQFQGILGQHAAAIESLVLTPVGTTLTASHRLLASGDAKGGVTLWHLGTREQLRTMPRHGASVSTLAFSPDGQTLVSGSWDMTVQLRQLSTGRVDHCLRGHLLPVASLVINPDGQLLVTGSHDSTLKLWQLPKGKLLTTLTGHIGPVEAAVLLPCRNTPSSPRIISGSRDGTLKLWQPES